jgi:hypothetical protein
VDVYGEEVQRTVMVSVSRIEDVNVEDMAFGPALRRETVVFMEEFAQVAHFELGLRR